MSEGNVHCDGIFFFHFLACTRFRGSSRRTHVAEMAEGPGFRQLRSVPHAALQSADGARRSTHRRTSAIRRGRPGHVRRVGPTTSSSSSINETESASTSDRPDPLPSLTCVLISLEHVRGSFSIRASVGCVRAESLGVRKAGLYTTAVLWR